MAPRHGLPRVPKGPHRIRAQQADGRYLRLPEDPEARHARFRKFSAADGRGCLSRYEDHISRPRARLLGPTDGRWLPQTARVTAAADLCGGRDGDFAVIFGGLWTERVSGWTSPRRSRQHFAEPPDRKSYFESGRHDSALAVVRVIGTWAGPRSPAPLRDC